MHSVRDWLYDGEIGLASWTAQAKAELALCIIENFLVCLCIIGGSEGAHGWRTMCK